MADTLTREQRNRCMSNVRNKDTKIELQVRQLLHSAGFRYRLNDRKLPGRPDIVLPRYNRVVFVHGCFWHGHSCVKGTLPKTNPEFWHRKISSNIERDIKNNEELQKMGWCVSVIWECQLITQTEALLNELIIIRQNLK